MYTIPLRPTIKLDKCPFCKADGEWTSVSVNGATIYFIPTCTECEASGPYSLDHSPKNLAKLWNTRVNQLITTELKSAIGIGAIKSPAPVLDFSCEISPHPAPPNKSASIAEKGMTDYELKVLIHSQRRNIFEGQYVTLEDAEYIAKRYAAQPPSNTDQPDLAARVRVLEETIERIKNPAQKALSVGKEAMPVEVKYWLDNGVLHCEMLPDNECVDPKTVYLAILEAALAGGKEDAK